uniref:Ig-like domain-containing protein n=1 Tax=Fundulus heteroclitus TaxID=8078 RepID=A0A3Q2TPA8_FUNHE
MMSFTLKLALLFTFSWITKSDFEFHSLVVRPGEEVTLQCSNFSNVPVHIFWFKLSDGPNVSSISSMQNSESEASFHDGFQRDKFSMTSNGTNIILSIKQVNSSDFGVYICGFKSNRFWRIFSETFLQVEGKAAADMINLVTDGFDGFNKLPNLILGSVIIFLLTVIVGLVGKIKTFHTVTVNPFLLQNLDSDTLNYAAMHFRPKINNNRRPAEREIDSNVLYAATT